MYALIQGYYQYGYRYQPRSQGPSILTIILVIILILFVIWLIVRFRKNKAKVVTFAHWHHSFEGLQISAQEFYQAVIEQVKAKNLPNVKIQRANYHEGGALSAEREYLRLRRFELVFDICAAPFGPGFFTSWWLGELPTAFQIFISMIPFMGGWLTNKLMPSTYYKRDTTLMYQEMVHNAVMEALDRQTTAKGIRALSESERKPFINEKFFR